ncbi:STAS domain-containing protein [Poseidonocella sp. HB161398]|uniref:STAS domain-containing protein n=1 Tax=Poseidonocella sp. HB161398 TaxID=2320855 RepID=UPI0011092484|nr:STAS domain-containing protein [Poseidonocella sp. HB161398]
MNLDSSEQPFGLLVTVGDSRIDASVAIQFKDRMRELTAGRPGRILLDLSQVDFVDSSGLGAIVAALKQLEADQTLELAALSPTVSKVFRLTRMDKVFPIHETLEQATGPRANAS